MRQYRVVGSIILAITVGMIVAYVVDATNRDPEDRWAIITEFHAWWMPENTALGQSMKFAKFEQCDKPSKEQTMRRVVDNTVVQAVPIVLKGNLHQRVTEAPLGESILHDTAKPLVAVVPSGEYQTTLVLNCTANGITKTTEAVRARFVVPEARP